MIFGSGFVGSVGMIAANVDSTIVDTMRTAAANSSDASNGSWIIEHVADSHVIEFQPFGEIHLPQFSPVHIGGLVIDFSLTKHIVMIWFAMVLLLIFVRAAMKSYRKNSNGKNPLVPRGLANVLEVIVVFVRDDIVLGAIGEKGRKLLPYFLTLFFFVLFSNLVGLIPYTSTPTGNINVTASLALIAFFVIQISGIVNHGFVGYFKGLMPPHIPLFVVPVMIIVELPGTFHKTIRTLCSFICEYVGRAHRYFFVIRIDLYFSFCLYRPHLNCVCRLHKFIRNSCRVDTSLYFYNADRAICRVGCSSTLKQRRKALRPNKKIGELNA